MPRIKVTGYIDIEDSEYDPGDNGPLTEECYMETFGLLRALDDVEFELAEEE